MITSILKSLESAPDRGHIILDFDIIELPLTERQTVVDRYGPWKFSRQFHKFMIVGIIKDTNEDLVVPPEYAMCSFGRQHETNERPPINHLNHPLIEEILHDSASGKN